MSRTDITAHAAAGADAAQRSVVPGAWLHIPSAAPGVLRVRPLPDEATVSYTQRLADTYQLTLPQLLDGANITLHRQGTPPAAELHLNHNAAQHLAVLTRTPLPHLTRALPRLAPNDDAHDTEAAARWKRLEAAQQPVRACTLCTRHRSHGSHRLRLDSSTAAPGRVPVPSASRPRPTTHLPHPHKGPCPNSPPRTTPTSASFGTHVPAPPGPQRAPSPPAGTTTSNTSPTAGTPA
ncbi:TniQ family protein [Streptomyces sp. NBC_01453]|uniref:TniQ family protein n=1 Tax=Streptomyces sp. NBC_01453 TaxID=2903873 RepID=UPI002E2C4D63|nr:TniQ family protein [Streptomyces sp. NBC_01453]